MGWRRMVLVGALLVAGCGEPAPTGPKVGDKIIVERGMVETWKTLDALRESKRGDVAPGPLKDQVVGLVNMGSLVEVVGVGEGWLAIDQARDQFGDPGKIHGYVATEDLMPVRPPGQPGWPKLAKP